MMSAFVDKAMSIAGALRAADYRALRAHLEAREVVTRQLAEALRDLSNMYSHAWDRSDGSLVMMLWSVPLFEDRHEQAQQALQAYDEASK